MKNLKNLKILNLMVENLIFQSIVYKNLIFKTSHIYKKLCLQNITST